MSQVRVRFAPSPTGQLHVGNVRTALFNWLFAHHHGGSFLLRVEDTDAERSQGIFERQLVEDLRWLEIDWDEGIDAGGDFGPYRQSERTHLYRQAATKLLEQGDAYYCFCSPEQLEADRRLQQERGESLRYVGRCRDLPPAESGRRVSEGETATIRLRVEPGKLAFHDLVFGKIEVDRSTIGDFILLRSDGSAQYNLACVVDDEAMKISHVIRGEGHLSNSYRQAILYERLHLASPEFAHLSTILGDDGSKLSKRHGATSITEFREMGYLPQALTNYLSLLGWTPTHEDREIMSVEEIAADFSLERVNVSPATFDVAKLNWVNRSHLQKLDPSHLRRVAIGYLQDARIVPTEPSEEVQEWSGKLLNLLVNYVDKLSDFPPRALELLEFDPERDLAAPEVRAIMEDRTAREVILAFRTELQRRGPGKVDFETYKESVLATQEVTGQKGKHLFRPIRLALTARASGPEIEKIVGILEEGSRLDLPLKVTGVHERVEQVCRFALEPDSETGHSSV